MRPACTRPMHGTRPAPLTCSPLWRGGTGPSHHGARGAWWLTVVARRGTTERTPPLNEAEAHLLADLGHRKIRLVCSGDVHLLKVSALRSPSLSDPVDSTRSAQQPLHSTAGWAGSAVRRFPPRRQISGVHADPTDPTARLGDGNGEARQPAAPLLLHGDDLASEGAQTDRDELEVRQPQRDPDDRQAQKDAGDEVQERKPPAGDEEPDQVADRGADAFAGLGDYCSSEGPDTVERDPQRGDAERDRDDQDEADEGGEGIADEQPEAGERKPDDVQQETHAATLTGPAVREEGERTFRCRAPRLRSAHSLRASVTTRAAAAASTAEARTITPA